MAKDVGIVLNGEEHRVPPDCNLADLVRELGLAANQVAAEINRRIVRRDAWTERLLNEGDSVEIVHFVGGGQAPDQPDSRLTIGGIEFRSRLIVGTGKYKTFDQMRQAHEASGADMVTVAVRRVNLTDRSKESLLDYIDRERIRILPNTAGCYNADEAIRYARLGREAGLSDLIKLEVLGDQRTLFPDNEELLRATETLVKEGFVVLPYTNDDPITCRKLEEAGAAAVMPLGAPIGSGLGIQNPNNIRIILEMVSVPVIVDAGVGTASDAAIAMELGVDGVLMNTGIAQARKPIAMARAMKLAVEAGRTAFRAGRIPKKAYASASSPLEGVLGAGT